MNTSSHTPNIHSGDEKAEPQVGKIWLAIISVIVFLGVVEVIGHYWFLGVKDKEFVNQQVLRKAPEMVSMQTRDAQLLNEYKLLDPAIGKIRIPIREAMLLLVTQPNSIKSKLQSQNLQIQEGKK